MQFVGCDHRLRVLLLIMDCKIHHYMKSNIKHIILLSAAILPVISCKAGWEEDGIESTEPIVESVENVEAEDNTSGIVPLFDIMIDHLDGHDRLQTVCVRLRNYYFNCRIHKE